MKKAISLVLAALMLMLTAMTALAAEDANTLVIEKADALLTPGMTYQYSITMQDAAGEDKPLDAESIGANKFYISFAKGRTAVESAEVKLSDSGYQLTLTLKESYTAAQTDIALTVALKASSGAKPAAEGSFSAQAGYAALSEDVLNGMTKGDSLAVENTAPVLTGKLLEALAKLNSYKNVTLSGDGWQLSANATGLAAQNLYVSKADVKAVLQAYEDASFKFLNFAGAPKFASKAEITVDVSDVEQDFDGSFTVYRWLGGKLYLLASSYDKESAQLTFAANNELGSYVIADRALSGSLLASGSASSGGGSSSNGNSSSTGSNSGSGSGSNSDANPDTGANDIVGIASALALVAVVSAAAVSLKK